MGFKLLVASCIIITLCVTNGIFSILLYFKIRETQRFIHYSKELNKVKFNTAKITVPKEYVESIKNAESMHTMDSYSKREE